MRKASLLIGVCLMLALALNVWAFQTSHPEIMQSINATRGAVTESIEAGNASDTLAGARQLQGLFESLAPIYERMNLAPAIVFVNKAAAIADETAEAAISGNMDAAGAAHGSIGKTCGGCHGQFRGKAEDGSFMIKTGG